MNKIKPLPAKKVIRALEKIGFKQIRQKGAHLFMRHPDGRTTLITVHPGEDIGKGMICVGRMHPNLFLYKIGV
jgi:predicted RNA binding protein YcfA (HicA-like mRNA interferase family)